MNKQDGDVLPPGGSSLRSGRLNPADYCSTREVLDLWNIAEPYRGAVRRELQRKCLTSRIDSAKKTEGRGDWRIPRAWAEDQANRLETLKNLKEGLADEGAHEIDLREGSAESSAADDAMFERRMQVVVLERDLDHTTRQLEDALAKIAKLEAASEQRIARWEVLSADAQRAYQAETEVRLVLARLEAEVRLLERERDRLLDEAVLRHADWIAMVEAANWRTFEAIDRLARRRWWRGAHRGSPGGSQRVAFVSPAAPVA